VPVYPFKYRARAFGVTFVAYLFFHLTRKVPSVVKSVLHPISSTGASSYDPKTNPGWAPFNQDLVPYSVASHGYVVSGDGILGVVNGKYNCDTPFSEKMPCKVYTREDSSKMDVSVELKLSNGCPFEGFVTCWMLYDCKNDDVLYAQRYNGTLPANAGASEAVGTIHWEKKKRDEQDLWEPYKDLKSKPDTTDGGVLLGVLDTVFLASYTVGLFFSGYLGDVLDLRYFLSFGMFGSALSMFFMGLAYAWKIHALSYFIILNVLFGFFQSIGWPSVVAVMGSWFGHGERGLVMGIWNAHTSFGNILGSVLAAGAIGVGMYHEDWPLGYALPGILMAVAAFFVFVTLIPHPECVGLETCTQTTSVAIEEEFEENDLGVSLVSEGDQFSEEHLAHRLSDGVDSVIVGEHKEGLFVTMKQVVQLPGLIPFSLSLMFSKMCAYSLLFWGPYYLGSVGFDAQKAGYLCSFFDVGGVFGGIVAGYLSDKLDSNAIVAFTFQVIGVPVMAFYYNTTASAGPIVSTNVWLMILVGFFINAPYALITTAVSADIGTQVEGNERLLSLVTGVIDGFGSFGACIQGIVVGWMSSNSWSNVWHFLMAAQAISALMLVRLVFNEAKVLHARWRGDD